MKWMDEKGRLFGKVNLFDLLVVLLIVVGAIGISMRVITPSKQALPTQTATYTLKISGVQEFAVDAFAKGDQIYEDGTLLGELAEVPKVEQCETLELQPDGTEGMVVHPLLYDITLEMKTDQFRADKGYHIGTNEMLNGTGHVISNGFISCTATVINIEIEE